MDATPATRPTFTWVHYAGLAVLVGAAILAPIGAAALGVYLIYLAVRYFRRRA
jgi:hypothetical protein